MPQQNEKQARGHGPESPDVAVIHEAGEQLEKPSWFVEALTCLEFAIAVFSAV